MRPSPVGNIDGGVERQLRRPTVEPVKLHIAERDGISGSGGGCRAICCDMRRNSLRYQRFESRDSIHMTEICITYIEVSTQHILS